MVESLTHDTSIPLMASRSITPAFLSHNSHWIHLSEIISAFVVPLFKSIKATFITLLNYPLDSFLSDYIYAELTSCTLKSLYLKVLRQIIPSLDSRQYPHLIRCTYPYFKDQSDFHHLTLIILWNHSLQIILCQVHIMNSEISVPRRFSA